MFLNNVHVTIHLTILNKVLYIYVPLCTYLSTCKYAVCQPEICLGQGSTNFQKFRNHLKILNAIYVTWRSILMTYGLQTHSTATIHLGCIGCIMYIYVRTEYPHILYTISKNCSSSSYRAPGILYPSFRLYKFPIKQVLGCASTRVFL